jgi:hypothetical protein
MREAVMLYLAQVQKKGFLGRATLRLLANQKTENAWSLVTEEDTIPCGDFDNLSDGLLVLAEISPSRQVLTVKDAKDWVIDIIQKFLTSGITPSFLQEETERAEQWRQSLTLQSQDLNRRSLELEARREQIQMLEDSLKREKRLVESMVAQYNSEKNRA